MIFLEKDKFGEVLSEEGRVCGVIFGHALAALHIQRTHRRAELAGKKPARPVSILFAGKTGNLHAEMFYEHGDHSYGSYRPTSFSSMSPPNSEIDNMPPNQMCYEGSLILLARNPRGVFDDVACTNPVNAHVNFHLQPDLLMGLQSVWMKTTDVAISSR